MSFTTGCTPIGSRATVPDNVPDRRRRLSPDERRHQIVAAARAAIARQSLAALSVRDIAAAAGVSVGTVTYHFAGIDEIFGELVIGESERFYRDAIVRADAEPDPITALMLITEPMFADTEDAKAHWRIWADYWGLVARRPHVAEYYADRIRSWEACCTRIIERGQADGAFTDTIDAHSAALRLAAYSDGLGMQLAQGVGGIDSASATTWLLDFARMLLTDTGGPVSG